MNSTRSVLVVAHSGVLDTYRRRWEVLASRGHRVTMLTPDRWTEGNRWVTTRPSPDSRLDLRVMRPRLAAWPSPRLRNVASYQPAVPALLEELAPEVLEVFEEPYSLAAWTALRAARRVAPGTLRLVFSAQNRVKRYPWPFSRFERDVLAWADAMLPCDGLVLPVLEAKGWRGPAPVVPLGVDPALFSPGEPDPAALPRAARGEPTLLFVGKLQEEKGVLDLVRALERMRAPAHLVCAGVGPLEARLARAHPRVHLLGPLDPPALVRLYRTASLVCVPSRTTPGWMEQFGRVAVEAMACGAAVLASRSGALPGVVAEGGRLLPEHDPAAWAEAADALLEDEGARRALGEAGRARALAAYTWEAVADAHERAWELAATARRTRDEAAGRS